MRSILYVIYYLTIGVGGQVDFVRGAALGTDGLGKPILAMASTTKKGESKIVPFLKEGKVSEYTLTSPHDLTQ